MSRKKDLAVACAIETLCIFALADTGGTIRMLIDAFPRSVELVNDTTMEVLTEGLGFKFEPTTPSQP